MNYAYYDNISKNAAIPGLVNVHNRVTLLIYYDNNKSVSIPGSVDVHDQMSEVDYLHGKCSKNVIQLLSSQCLSLIDTTFIHLCDIFSSCLFYWCSHGTCP